MAPIRPTPRVPVGPMHPHDMAHPTPPAPAAAPPAHHIGGPPTASPPPPPPPPAANQSQGGGQQYVAWAQDGYNGPFAPLGPPADWATAAAQVTAARAAGNNATVLALGEAP